MSWLSKSLRQRREYSQIPERLAKVEQFLETRSFECALRIRLDHMQAELDQLNSQIQIIQAGLNEAKSKESLDGSLLRYLQTQIDNQKVQFDLNHAMLESQRSLLEKQESILQDALKGIEQRRQEIIALHAELFDVPGFAELRFLESPIQDRLEKARLEVIEFQSPHAQTTEDEQQYLLMQMLFRGSIDDVRRQLEKLVDSVEVPDSCGQLPVVDIGCGRGEMLHTLNNRGFKAIGIDTNSLVVQRLREENLDAELGDAIERLADFSEASLCGITAFHIIEHLTADYTEALIKLAYAKIAPGGFFLIETPNPFCFESLSFFYTDKTHLRPIQPFQLAFLVENAGFVKTRAHFSAPVPATRRQEIDNWIRHYQNHGIIAYKPPRDQQIADARNVLQKRAG